MRNVRVACVGDSITRGTFVWRRRKNAYPAQLQALLGDGFCVRNFGVNGHAAQRTADRPYRSSAAFLASTEFAPGIVLIMLGTNDSRGSNWKGLSAFADGYRELVVHYRSLESHPAVWLLTPPALFRLGRSTKVRYGMDEQALAEMCGVIAAIACELGCGLIDINAATADRSEAFRLDGVHPGATGARLIAGTVFEALAGSTRVA
ncbi:MAG: hypothetical protein JXP37_04925 [Coriobacteriia bacterium]|nr:hypothetical protein [Coriobacteriia bacterium]